VRRARRHATHPTLVPHLHLQLDLGVLVAERAGQVDQQAQFRRALLALAGFAGA